MNVQTRLIHGDRKLISGSPGLGGRRAGTGYLMVLDFCLEL